MVDNTIFVLNFILVLAGLFVALRWNLARSWVWGVMVVPWGFTLIYFVFVPWIIDSPFIGEGAFNLIITFGLLGTCLGMFLAHKVDRRMPCPSEPWVVRNNVVDYLAIAYACFLFAEPARIALIQGPLAMFTRDRMSEYLTEQVGQGASVLGLIMTPVTVFFYLWVGNRIVEGQWGKAVLGVAALSMNAVICANTRFPIIMPWAGLCISWWYIKKRRTTVMRLVGVMCLAFFIFTAFNWIAALLRQGMLAGAQNPAYTASSEFGTNAFVDSQYYQFLHDLYAAKLPHEGGRQYWLSPIIAIIPRVLWPGKPTTSTANILSERVYGMTVGDGTPITTFSVFGEGFWQMGYIGAFIAPILYLVGYMYLTKKMLRIRGGIFCSAMIAMEATTNFRSEVPIVILLLWLINYKVIIFLRKGQ